MVPGTAKACADPKQPKPDCFESLQGQAHLQDRDSDANAGKAVRKIGYIDLLNMPTPTTRSARAAAKAFTTCRSSPSRTSIASMPRTSSSATTTTCRSRPVALVDKADDNEFVLLEVGEFLNAK
jgi:hypothetical protein